MVKSEGNIGKISNNCLCYFGNNKGNIMVILDDNCPQNTVITKVITYDITGNIVVTW